MSIYDNQLINTLHRLRAWERTQAGNSFALTCTQSTFAKFLAHPALGPYLQAEFPKALAHLQAYLAQPEETRDPRLDPFRLEDRTGGEKRTLLLYANEEGHFCQVVNWEDESRDTFALGKLTVTEPRRAPGSIYNFATPHSAYLEMLILCDTVPTYHHDLCIWLAEHLYQAVSSEEGRDFGKSLEMLDRQRAMLEQEV